VKSLLAPEEDRGTVSAALQMTGGWLSGRLEDAPEPRSRASVLQQIARLLLRVHDIESGGARCRPGGPSLISRIT